MEIDASALAKRAPPVQAIAVDDQAGVGGDHVEGRQLEREAELEVDAVRGRCQPETYAEARLPGWQRAADEDLIAAGLDAESHGLGRQLGLRGARRKRNPHQRLVAFTGDALAAGDP